MSIETLTRIKDAIDGQARAFDEFTRINDQRVDAIRAGKEALAKELDVKLDRINADLDAFRDRIEDIESKDRLPLRSGRPSNDPYTKSFLQWFRSGGTDRDAEAEMQRQVKSVE